MTAPAADASMEHHRDAHTAVASQRVTLPTAATADAAMECRRDSEMAVSLIEDQRAALEDVAAPHRGHESQSARSKMARVAATVAADL